jgi:hypothetical protein
MPSRAVITRMGELRRKLATGKCYITRVTGISEPSTFTLKPQGTTNPGTKALPWIYFGRIKDEASFKQFRTQQYYGNTYIIVPCDSPAGKQIEWKSSGGGGDYVKPDSLEPEAEQCVIDIREGFDNAEASESTNNTPHAAPGKGLPFCTIM